MNGTIAIKCCWEPPSPLSPNLGKGGECGEWEDKRSQAYPCTKHILHSHLWNFCNTGSVLSKVRGSIFSDNSHLVEVQFTWLSYKDCFYRNTSFSANLEDLLSCWTFDSFYKLRTLSTYPIGFNLDLLQDWFAQNWLEESFMAFYRWKLGPVLRADTQIKYCLII